MNPNRVPAIHSVPCGRMSNRTMVGDWEGVRGHVVTADIVRLVVVGSAMLLLWSIF